METDTCAEHDLPGFSTVRLISCERRKPVKMTVDVKQLILKYSTKLSPLKISRLLEEKYGIQVSRQTVWRFQKYFQRTGEMFYAKRKSRQSRITNFHIQVIDKWLCDNNELTSGAIVAKLKKTFCIDISKGYVSKIRRDLGWTARRLKYCQLISHVNREKRLTYAMEMLKRREQFLDVIFVDETTVEMNSNGRLFFYKPHSNISKLPARKQKPKHSYKVHVWGGISYNGRTDICIFTGIMDSIIYQQILEANLNPFTDAVFTDGYRLYQDNDSKHKSKSTKEWMKEHNMLENVMETPPSSPDLNPIENVWAAMKQYLQNTVKPKKKEELVQGIVDFWLSLTATKCAAYIDHIHKVLPYVVLNQGHPSGF